MCNGSGFGYDGAVQQPNGSFSVASETFSVFVPVSGAYCERRGYEGVEAYELWRMGPEATSEWNWLELYAGNGSASHDEGWLAFLTVDEAQQWMREYGSVRQPAILELCLNNDWLVNDALRLQLIAEGRLGGRLTVASLDRVPTVEEGYIRCFWLSVREPGMLERVETVVWRPEGWEQNILLGRIEGGVVWKPKETVRTPWMRVKRELG